MIGDKFLDVIEIMIDGKLKLLKFDKTFSSIVTAINDDGSYTIIKDKQEFKVKNSLGIVLSKNQGVWVKIPCGSLKDMHICGVR